MNILWMCTKYSQVLAILTILETINYRRSSSRYIFIDKNPQNEIIQKWFKIGVGFSNSEIRVKEESTTSKFAFNHALIIHDFHNQLTIAVKNKWFICFLCQVSKSILSYLYGDPLCCSHDATNKKPKQMNVKTIVDIASMIVIYLLLYSAQFQSLPISFRVITWH